MNPLVSVVIPAYKCVNTIERAINSISVQTYAYLEVVLINDLSPDWLQVEEKLLNYQQLAITVVHNAVNEGAAASRNKGIAMASGTFIAFLDADDEWYPTHIENCLNTYKEYKNDKTIVFSQSLIKTSEHADLLMPVKNILPRESVADYLFINKGFIATPSLFFNKEALGNIRFDENIRLHEDYDLFLTLEKNGFNFICTMQTGVIVHWENNDFEAKGRSFDQSINWIKKKEHVISKKAYSYFIVKQVIFGLFRKGEKLLGLQLLLKHVNPLLLNIKTIYILISLFLFTKVIANPFR